MGDYLVTQPDVQNGAYFEDAVGNATWGIDLHYETSTSYLSTYTSTAVNRWYFPLRSLYSRNVPNLLMAGRCISVSHVGLGSPRVQNTTGQMGVAVGYAVALCKQYGIEPRDIYRSADRKLELQARIGGVWPERPRLTGQIVDNTDAACVTVQGAWTSSTYDSGFVGTNYLHDGNNGKGQKSVCFRPVLTNASVYEVLLRWTSSNNRATNTPVTILTRTNPVPVLRLVNQQTNGARWNSLGFFDLSPDTARIVVATADDRDSDGLPDWWERWYFLSETAADPRADADGDGLTNYQEYLTGTDPTNLVSRFVMRALLDAAPSQAVIAWPSITNRTYRIEVSNDLNSFHLLRQGIPATPPQNSEIVLLQGAKHFFRVIAE